MLIFANRLGWVAVFLAMFVISGCGGPTYQRGSDNAELDEKVMSRKLDHKDVDIALAKLMDNLEKHFFMQRTKQAVLSGQERPGIAIDIIVNESDQRIDTSLLAESFQTKIIKFGVFKVVSYEHTNKFKRMLNEQGTDWYDGATVPNAGNLCGFKYIIGGKLHGGTERTSGEARTQYRLILKAMDIETGVIEWQDSADITKFQD